MSSFFAILPQDVEITAHSHPERESYRVYQPTKWLPEGRILLLALSILVRDVRGAIGQVHLEDKQFKPGI